MAVTPESNLALIEELQDLVGASTYEPVDGPELSYPAVGQAVDDEMWKYITLALGDGVWTKVVSRIGCANLRLILKRIPRIKCG